MSALQLAELDYIYKKIAASTVKTDNATSTILATSQNIFTSPIISSDNVWTESATLELGPSAASSIVSLRTRVKMTSAHGVGPNPDIVALTGMAWTSGITNWVDKKFHIGFAPTFEVASGTNPAPGDYKTIDNSSDYPMIFDYKSGVLTFLVRPYAANGVDLTAKTGTDTTWHVYITGYTYLGRTLDDSQENDPIAIGPNAGMTGQSIRSIAIGRNSGQTNQSRGSIAIGHNSGSTGQGGFTGATITTKTLTLRWTTPGPTSFDLSTLDAVPGTISGQFDIVGGGGQGGSPGGGSAGGGGGGGGAYGRLQIPGLAGIISGTVGAGGIVEAIVGRGEDTSLTVTTKGIQRSYLVGGGYSTSQGSGGGNVQSAPPLPIGRYDSLIPVSLNNGNGANGGPTGAAGYLGYGGGGPGSANSVTSGQAGAILITLTYQGPTYSNSGCSVAIGNSSGAVDQSANSVAIGNSAGSSKQGVIYAPKTLTLRWTTPGATGFNLSTLSGARDIKVDFTIVGAAGGDYFTYNPSSDTPGNNLIRGGGGGAYQTALIDNPTSSLITATVGAVGLSTWNGLGDFPSADRGSPSSLSIGGQTYTVEGGWGAGNAPEVGFYSGEGGFGTAVQVSGQRGIPVGSGFGYAVNPLDKHGCGANPNNGVPVAQDGAVLITITCIAPLDYAGGNSIAIGNSAGQHIQADGAIAIGHNAGNTGQQSASVAIGNSAAASEQGEYSVAIGNSAAASKQGEYSVAIGYNAGNTGQQSASVALGNQAAASEQGNSSVAIGNSAASFRQALKITGTVTTKTLTINWTTPGSNSFDLSTLDAVPGTISGQFDIVGGGGSSRVAIPFQGYPELGAPPPNIGAYAGGGGAYGRLQIPDLTETISGTVATVPMLLDGGPTTLTVTTKGTRRSYSAAGGERGQHTRAGFGGAASIQPVPGGPYDSLIPAPLNNGNNGNGITPGAGYLGYGAGGPGFVLSLSTGSSLYNGIAGAILITLTYQTQTSSNSGCSVAIGNSAGAIDQSSYSVAIGNNAGSSIQGGLTLTTKTRTIRWTTPGSHTFNLSTLRAQKITSVNFTIVGGPGGDYRLSPIGFGGYNVLFYGGGGGAYQTLTINNPTSSLITATVGAAGESTYADAGAPGFGGDGEVTSININNKVYMVYGGGGASNGNINPAVQGRGGEAGGSTVAEPIVAGKDGWPTSGNSVGYSPNIYERLGSGGTNVNGISVAPTHGAVLMTITYIAAADYAGGNSVAIGNSAGQYIQGDGAIAIGYNAGNTGQQTNAIAIGPNAGTGGQYPGSIAIGQSASNLYPGYDGPGGIAIGRNTRSTYTGVAIGENSTAATDGGGGSLALGVNAFALVPRSIVINGSGAGLTSTVSGLYVNPIRTSGAQPGLLEYNPSTKEITHAQVYAYSYGKSANDNQQPNVIWDEVMTATTSGAMVDGLWTCPKTGYWKMDATILENGDNTKYFFRNGKPIIGSVFLLNDNYGILQYRSMHLIALLYLGDKIGIGTWRGVNYARAGSSFTIYYIGSS